MTPEQLNEISREADDHLCLYSQPHYRWRLRQLLTEVEHFYKSGIIEIAVRNRNVASWMIEWENRALKAEAEAALLKDWRQTALRIGEMLADTGPNGYYDFDPATWAAWCDGRVRQLLAEVQWFRDAVSVLGFDAPGGDGVNPLKERLAELLKRAAPSPVAAPTPAAHTPDPLPTDQSPSQSGS